LFDLAAETRSVIISPWHVLPAQLY